MGQKSWRLILASRSPRRRSILKEAGFKCTSFPSNSSESFDENLTLHENLAAIAEDKIAAIESRLNARNKKGILILAADTVVVAGNRVLGKPKNRADAQRMLRLLSGKTHSVKTAFSIYCPDQGRGVTRVITTQVGFRALSRQDLQWYLDSGEPFDKAGSYAIQGLGARFVCFLKGDLLNVVGLPINEFEQELRTHGWNVRRRKRSRRS